MNKVELKSRLEESYNLLLDEVQNISDTHWKTPLRDDWNNTIHDLFSHIVGWDIECLKAAKIFMNGKRPEYEGIEDAVFNAKFLEDYKNYSKEEILQAFKSSREEIYKFLDNVSEEEIANANSQGFIWKTQFEESDKDFLDDPYKQENLKMELHTILDLSWHDKEHLEDIRRFKKEHNID